MTLEEKTKKVAEKIKSALLDEGSPDSRFAKDTDIKITFSPYSQKSSD